MSVGAVPYHFRIGEVEITTSQWVRFLNTVDPMGTNANRLWDVAESAAVWPKYGSINRDLRATPGQRYYLASPGWANRPYNQADFSRAARFINSLQNGRLLSKTVRPVTTVSGAELKTITYRVRLSPKTETGMYTMSNLRATRNATKGFALNSQNEWIKAAYFDPNGGGKFSYWSYPTNPGLFVNCPVDESGCAEGEQPNAVEMGPDGNITNADQQPLASFEAIPGTAPDWCPVVSLTAEECTKDAPFPPLLPYNGNVSPVGQALTRSPWGTLDQGGNVVETLDTISPPPALTDPKVVWRRWHGGVVTATAYQMWLSAVGTTPQTVPGYAVNPWRGFRISVRGLNIRELNRCLVRRTRRMRKRSGLQSISTRSINISEVLVGVSVGGGERGDGFCCKVQNHSDSNVRDAGVGSDHPSSSHMKPPSKFGVVGRHAFPKPHENVPKRIYGIPD